VIQKYISFLKIVSIVELLPYSNAELEDYITEKCEFGSQFVLRAACLTDRDMKIIVRRVIINRQCSGLNLRKNQITSQGALLIATVFHRNIRLRILDLSYNDISDNGTQYLAEALLENTTLKELSLGSNEITNQGIKYLTEMLQRNRTLKKLDLFENEFDDDGLKLLTDVLSRDNQTLVELSIRSNKLITDRSLYSIIDMLNENRTLDRIEIDQCDFSNGTKTRLRDAAENKSITIDI
jgi:Ran GTPase-activating protein (RanGAP) involved in mRNA processing and transport